MLPVCFHHLKGSDFLEVLMHCRKLLQLSLVTYSRLRRRFFVPNGTIISAVDPFRILLFVCKSFVLYILARPYFIINKSASRNAEKSFLCPWNLMCRADSLVCRNRFLAVYENLFPTQLLRAGLDDCDHSIIFSSVPRSLVYRDGIFQSRYRSVVSKWADTRFICVAGVKRTF